MESQISQVLGNLVLNPQQLEILVCPWR